MESGQREGGDEFISGRARRARRGGSIPWSIHPFSASLLYFSDIWPNKKASCLEGYQADLSQTRIRPAVEARARPRPGAAGWRASELPQAESRCAHTRYPPRGGRAVHGERGAAAAVLPPLKREAVRTSESHPISLPLSPALFVVPSIRRPVRPSSVPLSLRPSLLLSYFHT